MRLEQSQDEHEVGWLAVFAFIRYGGLPNRSFVKASAVYETGKTWQIRTRRPCAPGKGLGATTS